MEYEVFSWRLRFYVDMFEFFCGVDFERVVKVSGVRFYYFFNEFVIFDFVLICFVLDKFIEKGFILVIFLYMVRCFVEEGVIIFGDFEDVIYKVEGEDFYFILIVEYLFVGMYVNEIFDGKDLLFFYVGVSLCFRKEVGIVGKDMKGIFCVY